MSEKPDNSLITLIQRQIPAVGREAELRAERTNISQVKRQMKRKRKHHVHIHVKASKTIVTVKHLHLQSL